MFKVYYKWKFYQLTLELNERKARLEAAERVKYLSERALNDVIVLPGKIARLNMLLNYLKNKLNHA